MATPTLTERRTWTTKLKNLSVLGISMALVAPWIIRNVMFYGDPVANSAMPAAVPDLIHRKSITAPFFVHEFPVMLFKSFVGLFGWVNVLMPGKAYLLFGMLGLIGAAAAAWRFAKRREDRRLMFIVATIPAIILALTVQLNLTFDQPQGRYLFPALTAAAVLFAMGLEALPHWNRRWTTAALVLLCSLNLGVLGFSIIPAYWAIPRDMFPVDVQVPLTAKLKAIEPLQPGRELVQTFVAQHDGLTKVDVRVQSRRGRPGSVKLRLQTAEPMHEIASWTVPIAAIPGDSYAGIRFPAVEQSKGKAFRIVLEADQPDSLSLPVAESGDLYYRALYEPRP